MKPQRRGTAHRASVLYAQIGPSPAQIARRGLDPAKVTAQWKRWADRYLERWERGDRVPEPPHADLLDTFARPAAWPLREMGGPSPSRRVLSPAVWA